MKWLRKIFQWEKAPDEVLEPRKNETFERYIDRQGFKYFSGSELATYFNRKIKDPITGEVVHNQYPPRFIWPNFVPTLKVIDKLRGVLNCPVRITSSFRSLSYNKAVGGAPRSFHKVFKAADIQADCATPHEVYLILKGWRERGEFKGGLGLYKTFVHIDTRGENKDW